MDRMRCAVLALSVVGCNQIYGLDPTQVRDLEPTECSTIQFGPPMSLAQFDDNGVKEFDAQLSADGKELWFITIPGPLYVLHRGVWNDRTGEFDVVDVTPIADSGITEPALTADGRRLMFVGDRNGTVVFEGVRADPDAGMFDSVRVVVGLEAGVESLDLSWDGLRIYYTVKGSGELWTAARPARDEPFGTATLLFDGAIYPSVSPDELEVFYNHHDTPNPLYRRTRPDRARPFGPEALVLDEGEDPDVAPTSDTMIVARNNGLSLMHRVCPGK